MSDIEKYLVKTFCEICEIEEGSFGVDDQLDSCEEWDSLNLLSLLTEIDDKYGVTISSDNVDDFKTLSDFAKYIEQEA